MARPIRSKRVIEVLSRLVSVHGAPLFMRSDNGPPFVSHAILEQSAHAGIATAPNDQECFHLSLAHLGGMPPPVEADEGLAPVHVGLLGAAAAMQVSSALARLVKQSR